MCGIVGAYSFDGFEKKSEEKQRTEANIFITTQLLQMTVDRGKDATGIAMVWADGNYAGLKMGIPSPDFIARFGEEETEFKGMMKMWREYPKLCKTFLGHCRKASKGNSYDNKNNHPLQVGDMIYVHNGTLNNDDVIFEKLGVKRAAEVDSEAIGYLLKHFTNNGTEPFTKEVMEETTKRLAGTYSVIATSGNNPYQVAQFRDGRPAEFVFVKPLKTVFVASEKKYLENVLFEYNKFTQLFSAVDMPYLKKDDVEFKTMADDSYVIWDLTTPITEETTIDDLYDWAKTPLRVDKIWQGATTTTTYGNNWNGNTSKKTVAASSVGTNKTNSASAETAGTTTSTTDSTEESANGVLWSKRLNKYKTQNGIEKSKGIGAVEIDIDAGEVTVVDDGVSNEEAAIDEVDKTRIENILCGAANVKDVSSARIVNAVEKVKKPGPSRGNQTNSEEGESVDGGLDESSELVEVTMNTKSPAAIKAAETFFQITPKFKDDDDLLSALDITDVSVLKALPMYALANRIMKFALTNAFALGYTAAERETQKPFTEEGEKLQKAKDKIGTMKMLLKIMGTSLEQMQAESNIMSADVQDIFLDAISDNLKPDVLKRLQLDDILTVGDLRNIPMVAELKQLIDEEKSK